MPTLRLTGTLLAAITLTACSTDSTSSTSSTSSTNSITTIADENVATMPPVTAIVESKDPCAALFRTPDGRRFYIGGPDSGGPVTHFVHHLQVGKSYRLPDDYLRHQNQ